MLPEGAGREVRVSVKKEEADKPCTGPGQVLADLAPAGNLGYKLPLEVCPMLSGGSWAFFSPTHSSLGFGLCHVM